MESNNYETPKSNLIQTADSSTNFNFKKTKIMNGIAGLLFSIMVVGFFTKFGEIETQMLIIGLITFGVMAATAISSMLALSPNAWHATRITATILNWFCIVLFLFSILGAIIMLYQKPTEMISYFRSFPMTIFMLAVPQAINLRALRKIKLQLKS